MITAGHDPLRRTASDAATQAGAVPGGTGPSRVLQPAASRPAPADLASASAAATRSSAATDSAAYLRRQLLTPQSQAGNEALELQNRAADDQRLQVVAIGTKINVDILLVAQKEAACTGIGSLNGTHRSRRDLPHQVTRGRASSPG